MNKRFIPSILISLILLLALAPVTTAAAHGKPIRTDYHFPTITYEGVCGFDVLAQPLTDKGMITFFDGKDVPIYLITGIVKVRFSNLTTGKAADVVIAGSMKEEYSEDGSYKAKIQGPFLGFGIPGNPALAYVNGQQEIVYDADWNLIAYKQTGTVEDLCATLAE